jgi:AraC-like DNA-binding protein
MDDGLAEAACLERLCKARSLDRLAFAPEGDGLLRLEACLAAHAYRPHRHDTYAIGITLSGVQRYTYRKARRESLPGEVVILHPDELHDGEAGTASALLYRMLYIRPEAIREALGARASALPFVRGGHSKDRRLSRAVLRAVDDVSRPLQPLEADEAVADVAEALLALDRTAAAGRMASSGVPAAIRRARDLLEEAGAEPVSAHDLEVATGLSRFDLIRHFRRAFGTSPHRYLVMRRLERARDMMRDPSAPLADIAAATGFADQAHLTRQFGKAFGFTPGLWRSLTGNPRKRVQAAAASSPES